MKHKLVTELCVKPRRSWSSEEKQQVKDLLDGFKQKGKPIYPYIKNREIYFQLVYDNKFFVNYRRYEDAEKDLIGLREGSIKLEDLAGDSPKKRKELVTLEDAYNKLVEREKLAKKAKEFKNNSFEKNGSDFKYHVFPYFKGKPIIKITRGDIDDYVAQITYNEESQHKRKDGSAKKLSASTQIEILNLFKRLYREAKRYYGIETTIDIDYEVKMPTKQEKKEKRENKKKIDKILNDDYDAKLKKTLESIAIIENGIYNPVFAIELLNHSIGSRINEANALKPSKLDVVNRQLLIDASISWHPDKENTDKSYEETSTKTDEERIISLCDTLFLYLEEYISILKKLSYYSDDMYIFSRLEYSRDDSMKLDPFSLKTFNNHIRFARKHAGIVDDNGEIYMVKNHIARHAFNSMMKDGGVYDYDREEYIGHAHSGGTNVIYTHKSAAQEKRILKIQERFVRYLTKDIPQFQELYKKK